MKYFLVDTHYDAFKQGCPHAFNAIYKLYHRRIYWMGRSLVRDVFVVESLVQDTFLILWEKRELIESPAHLHRFLFTVISTECKWYYARPKNRFNRDLYALDAFLNYQDYMLGHDPTKADEHVKDQQDRQKDYEQVITLLPLLGHQSKRLIELALQHGFKYKTIANQMGISIKEASNLMKESIAQIKTILKTEQSTKEHSTPTMQITKQEAQVLDLRCKQQYTFAQIASELKLSQKEVHRAFTTAYQFLQQQHHNALQSA